MSAVEQENIYFRKIIAAFRNYRRHSLAVVERKRRGWQQLSAEDRKRTPFFLAKLDFIRFYIEGNAFFISQFVPNQPGEEVIAIHCESY
jgi:hypothetical protein